MSPLRIALSLCAVLLVAAPALADRESAEYFATRGRDALESGDLEAARKHFEKSLAEYADYLPAVLGLARVAEAAGDNDMAVAHLVRCLNLHASTPEELEARNTAETLLKRLDRPRLEYLKLVNGYVKQLLKLARREKKKTPALARRCVERVLDLLPDHKEARKLLESLGAAPAAAAPPTAALDPAGPVEKRLFNGKDFEGWSGARTREDRVWQVKNGMIAAAAEDSAYMLRTLEPLKGDFCVEYEMRVVEETGGSPLVQLVIGVRGTDELWSLDVWRDKFVLGRCTGTVESRTKLMTVRYYEMKGGFERTEWATYRLEVKRGRLTVTIRGEKVFEYEAKPGELDGVVGLVVQDCSAEFRRIARLN